MFFKKISLITVSFLTKLISFAGIALSAIIFLSIATEAIETFVSIPREFKSFLVESRAINSAISKGIYSSSVEDSLSTLLFGMGKEFSTLISKDSPTST